MNANDVRAVLTSYLRGKAEEHLHPSNYWIITVIRVTVTGVSGRRLAVVHLTIGEATKVHGHFCAFGVRDVTGTGVRRNRGISTAAHHAVEGVVIQK